MTNQAVRMSEKKQIEVEADSRKGPDQYTTDVGIENDTTIPGGQLDPVYEKKARLLNRAVSLHGHSPSPRYGFRLTCSSRSKILAWAGTNGSSSSLLGLAGLLTISGPL